MDDLLNEDREISEHLAELGLPALRELEAVLNAPQVYRDDLQRALIARPELSDSRSSWRWPTPMSSRIRLPRDGSTE